MRVDYHMHLEMGSLSLDYLERFCQQAQRAGLDEIGISEHGHNFRQYRKIMEHLWTGEGTYPKIVSWLKKGFSLDLDVYVDLIQEGKQRGWPLKLGLEMDYIPGKEAEIAALIDAYPWDYVLGSVHFLGKWAFDVSPEVGWPDKDVNSAYHAYFTAMLEAVSSGLFDSITHPDLIKIFGHRPRIPLEPYYEAMAEALAQSDTCVEINAAGLRKPVGIIYPEPEFLAKCQQAGVPITLACDAHYPEDVGKGLDEAIELARSAGYTEVAIFTGRQRTLQPLG
ncbi:MAG: histidinol-phosphatase HisJ family protein [Firmicutes bacterium]|jgi:histidinol-phosphatase (PHP family)|nr:histidinol-phosphatase HisJ family protein [Bacillota bacterium]